jgi:putative ABC transport system permease protein
LWPGEDPIGKRIGIPTFKPGERGAVWRRVIGVVANVRYRGLDDPWLDIYDPASQAALVTSSLIVRTSADPLGVAAAVQARARELDPRAVIDGITTMDAVVSRAVAPWRLSAWMLSLFAGLAFLLATIGLFSLVSLDVASRRHEFAVRLAVGALGRDILRTVMATASLQVCVGIGLGLIGALAGARALQSLLFGIEWMDAATYAAVLLVVLAVVTVAAYLPARRAARIEPLALLRRE